MAGSNEDWSRHMFIPFPGCWHQRMARNDVWRSVSAMLLLAFRFCCSKHVAWGLLAGGELAVPCGAAEPSISACCGLA